MIRIGLPKGIVKGKSLAIVERLISRQANGRCLKFREGEICLYLLKHRDIPNLLAGRRLDMGITSTEWIVERTASLHILTELDWCDTRISLIGPAHRSHVSPSGGGTCVTEFPNIARTELPKYGFGEMKVHEVSGSAEAMVPDLYDYCVDCIETGETLRDNGLTEIRCLMNSRVAAVCRPDEIDRGLKAMSIIQGAGCLE